MGEEETVGGKGGGGDDEVVTVGEVEGDLLEAGLGEDVAVSGRTDGIEADGGENVPGRHLAGIIVAGETSGGIVVLGVEDMGHALDGLITAADEVVEVGDLVTGLVTMPVMALVEEGVELGLELLGTTKERDKALDVVGDVPGVVAGGSFGEPRSFESNLAVVLKKLRVES